ncbi:hypothetical protein FQA47_025344 [Oryzias melastigma]|uniref:Uncharacterized protein n=1 Tax=Oryzias melastigma TaxID=30732 RepID=A0A834FRI0_ORYME|nr:hypothetical protein FQA47_025344 [Oryzias melastigma]
MGLRVRVLGARVAMAFAGNGLWIALVFLLDLLGTTASNMEPIYWNSRNESQVAAERLPVPARCGKRTVAPLTFRPLRFEAQPVHLQRRSSLRGVDQTWQIGNMCRIQPLIIARNRCSLRRVGDGGVEGTHVYGEAVFAFHRAPLKESRARVEEDTL